MTEFRLAFLLNLALFSLPAPLAFCMDLPRFTQRSPNLMKLISYDNQGISNFSILWIWIHGLWVAVGLHYKVW